MNDEDIDYIECEQCGELVPDDPVVMEGEMFQSSNGSWYCKRCYKGGQYDDGDDYE